MIWAANKGIVTGYGDDTFGVNDLVTREQTVAILYRYAKAMGRKVTESCSLETFMDTEKISEYAEDAFSWAVKKNIVEGKPAYNGKMKLDPSGITERVEMAALLMRFAKFVR